MEDYNLKQLLTLEEVAAMVGISKSTMKRWHKEGRIPAECRFEPSRRTIRYRRDKVIAWLRGELPPAERPRPVGRPRKPRRTDSM